MRHRVKVKTGLSVVAVLAGLAWVIGSGASCGSAPQPFIVTGPGGIGNDPPTLQIIEPDAHLTRSQGDLFLLRWTDTDRDDNAKISFSLVSTTTNATFLLIAGLDEDDATGADSFTVNTSLLPPDTYNIVGVIFDGENAPVDEYAMVGDAAVSQRVVVTIVPPGEGPQTVPPVIEVIEPSFNQSVAQDDVLTVTIQPSRFFDPNDATPPPFDPDSTLTLYILLDLDQDPNNDDPANPDASQIIVLLEQSIAEGTTQPITFEIPIDLAQVPPRSDGESYLIRATVDDGTNPRVHKYATGTINVVQLAAGVVDIFDIGRTKSGTKLQGFNPNANLGSTITGVQDFDADGTDDFVVVARFGNPQNMGPVGEAYLIYGRDSVRFGNTIPVNSVGEVVPGVVFQAPPVRTALIPDDAARTEGIMDASFIEDMNADGRPELLFGLPHVHGAFDGMDYDPGDGDPATFGCYPDFLVNNLTDPGSGVTDNFAYAGGMGVIVNSTNRDSSGLINTQRLESTVIDLELCGQPTVVLGVSGQDRVGNVFPRADNALASNIGTDTQEGGRIAGARMIAGGYDSVRQDEGPREGLFGRTFRSLGDLTADGLSEFVVSAPLNERYLADLQTAFGFTAGQFQSTIFDASITVLPGTNYNLETWRDENDEGGAAITPFIDHWRHPDNGDCEANPPEPRHFDRPTDSFGIFAEDVDDFLGDGQSAGDFNQDGLDDILCGAPLNDRSGSLVDSGATYVIYARSVFGEIQLADADSATVRPPMLRLRGLNRGDQIGWQQTSGLDVNGDRIDDVFVASPYTDFGDVERVICAVDFNGDGIADADDLKVIDFNSCRSSYGDEVFSDDGCKAFDYDNDGDIDDEDRCVFCCLSDDCEVDDTCVNGRGLDCCADMVDNGFVGVIFGGEYIDGDRTIAQLATSQLPGVVFYGAAAGYRAGVDISSAGDFNQDGFGDILIAVPGEPRLDSAGRTRQGVVYLIFGGTHLTNTTWSLADVGSTELPGIVFLSPYTRGRPNEAAPESVAYIGDINSDGFGDIAIGNPKADFIDSTFPQGPDAPGSDPSTGRRSNVGDAYIIYGNNFGANRKLP